MSGESHLTIETLLAITILIIYTIAAPVFEKYHFHYIHESGVCMLIGVGVTILAMLVNPDNNFSQTLEFNDEIFFTFILPPIIFAAGYNLRRRAFFKYFIYIMIFAVCGTIVTFLVVTPLTYIANKNEMFYFTVYIDNNKSAGHVGRLLNSTYNETILDANSTDLLNDIAPVQIINFSIKEILLFVSVICATDAVAALTFVKEETQPKLFSILFGEGVINDAVCIVLYKILRDFTSSNEEFTAKTPFRMFGTFVVLFISSFIIGMLVGCLSSLFLKEMKRYNLNRVQECSLMLFFAFISYTLTEELDLSPIIALLFTGIFMSHYTFWNLSFQAREESAVVSRVMSNIAEAFVFTYLGLTLVYYMTHSLSLSFILIEFVFIIIGRIVCIYGLSWLMGVLKVTNFRMKFSEKGIMCCAGSIRGAIAFGLAISIDTTNMSNKQVLVSSTLILVFFTTIVFGALMPFIIRFFQSYDIKDGLLSVDSNDDLSENKEIFSFVHPNFIHDNVGKPKETNIDVLKKRLSYWLGHYWIEFDDVYIKPKLVDNWPEVKEESDTLATKIKETIHKYQKEKLHPKIKFIELEARIQDDQEFSDADQTPPTKSNLKRSKLTEFNT